MNLRLNLRCYNPTLATDLEAIGVEPSHLTIVRHGDTSAIEHTTLHVDIGKVIDFAIVVIGLTHGYSSHSSA